MCVQETGVAAATCPSRDELIVNYMPLANKVARERCKGLPPHIDFEEIQSAAYMGLVDAAEKFRPNQGAFGPYAKLRITGEILDYLRSLSWGKRDDPKSYSSIYDENAAQIEAPETSGDSELYEKVTRDMAERDKEMFLSHYRDGEPLKNIGGRFGCTSARVCQVLKQSRQAIQNRFQLWELYDEIAA